MGYGFMIYAVDTDKLKQVAGSKDDKIRRMIGGRFKRDLAQLDDLFDYAISAGGPNTYEALRQIIDGTIPEGARGSIYSYAFKLIVEHFGKFLDNSEFMPWNSASFAPVNAAIAEMGVDFKLDGFLHGGDLPVKLPQPDDFPMTAWLDAAAVKKIDAAFGTATYKGADEEAGRALACARKWFRDAAGLGRGLVSYYH